MSAAVTALAELTGLLQTAGVEPDKIVALGGLLANKPHLRRWLDVSGADRHRILGDHAAATARHQLNLGGGPR